MVITDNIGTEYVGAMHNYYDSNNNVRAELVFTPSGVGAPIINGLHYIDKLEVLEGNVGTATTNSLEERVVNLELALEATAKRLIEAEQLIEKISNLGKLKITRNY